MVSDSKAESSIVVGQMICGELGDWVTERRAADPKETEIQEGVMRLLVYSTSCQYGILLRTNRRGVTNALSEM